VLTMKRGLRECLRRPLASTISNLLLHVVALTCSYLEIRACRQSDVHLDEFVPWKVRIRIILDQVLGPEFIRKLTKYMFEDLSVRFHIYLVLINILGVDRLEFRKKRSA